MDRESWLDEDEVDDDAASAYSCVDCERDSDSDSRLRYIAGCVAIVGHS